MDIKIQCKGADTLPLGDLKDFQGNLKTISPENLAKLKASIKKHGFSAPFFIWDNAGVKNLLDGHQRMKALIDLQAEGNHVPDLPVVYIYADDEKHAREKLLYISSQYGEFTREGYTDFTFELEDLSDLRLVSGDFWLGDVPDFEPAGIEEQGRLDEKKKVTCPECGCEF